MNTAIIQFFIVCIFIIVCQVVSFPLILLLLYFPTSKVLAKKGESEHKKRALLFCLAISTITAISLGIPYGFGPYIIWFNAKTAVAHIPVIFILLLFFLRQISYFKKIPLLMYAATLTYLGILYIGIALFLLFQSQ